ncbi:MAG: histone deacetylase [Ardenticatenaceae bacterium]|nr:histone deacetylase [Ardenticatenaceae bacterium]MCB8986209.1 histone deacetylase [Ardenticatenaceae bacterium]
MSSLLVYVPAPAHTKPYHPESHHRLESVMTFLEGYGVLPDLLQVEPMVATMEQLMRVHTAVYVERLQQISWRGGGLLDHGDTYATAESFRLARLAAGGCCEAVDYIMSGKAGNGIALVRPPGHHASTNQASGFCLLNNTAVAARQAQAAHGAKRVAVIDFDVHHGNGTQEIFYLDDSVLFVSAHLFAPFFYPGIGRSHEIGAGHGLGYTLNVPLPPFVGDEGYCRIMRELVLPKVAAFQPDLLLVSAGFDAHWQDPLAEGGLSLKGYANICRYLVQMAGDLCNGRILFILEGGYELQVLNSGILNTVYTLLGRDEVKDDIGPMPQAEQDVTDLLQQLKDRHLLN